jgi:hypothetical protein
VAGTDDLPTGTEDIDRVDARWRASLAREQPGLAPGMHLLRVASTLAEMRRAERKSL